MANVFLGSVYANLELRDSGWSSGISQAQRNIKNFNQTTSDAAAGSESFSKRFAVAMGVVSGIASSVVNKAIGLISNSIDAAVRRVDTLHASAKTFEYMGFSSTAASKATEALKESILGLPTPLDQAMRGMTALAATYGDVELGQKMFTAINNAVLGFGGTADMATNAINQLSQLPMDGPLDAQTWMSLRNSGLTPVLVAMSKDMHTSVSQLKEDFGSGKLKVSDFVNELIKMDKEGGGGLASLHTIALNATSGIATGFANMQTAISRGIAAIIDSVGQKNISTAISQIGTVFENTLKGIATVVPQVMNVLGGLFGFIGQNASVFQTLAIAVLAGVVAWKAYVTTMAIVKAVTTAYTAASAALSLVMALQAQGLGVVRAAWMALTIVMNANPIGIIITVIAAVIAALVFLQMKFNIFGKAFEALKPIFKAVGDFFVDVFKNIGNFFTSVFNGVASFFQKWGKVIIGVFALLFAPIVAPIAAIILIVKNWQTITQTVGDAIGAIFKTIGDVIGAVFNTISNVYKATLKPVVDGIIFVVTSLATIWWTVWSGIAQVVFTVVSTIVQIIGVVLYGSFLWLWNNVLVPTGQFFANVWNGIVTAISTAVGFIGGVISTAFNFYVSVITTVLNTIWNVVTSVWNAIWGFIQPILSAIGGFFSAVWNGILSVVSSVVNTLAAVVSGVFNGIKNTAINIFNGLKSGIQSVISGVYNIVISPIQNAYNWLVGQVQNFLNVGKNIIDGIVRGVTNGKDAVVNKIKDICNGALDAVKSFFGIKSPSRVMAKMFGYVVAGGVKGLDDNRQSLQDSFANTFNTLPDLIAEPTIGATISYAQSAANSMRPESVNASNSGNTYIYGDISVDSKNDDETVLEQLDRGVVLSGKGMASEA